MKSLRGAHILHLASQGERPVPLPPVSYATVVEPFLLGFMAVASGGAVVPCPPFHVWLPELHEAVEILCAVADSQ